MNANDYQNQAMRTNDGKSSYRLSDAFRKSFDMNVDIPELLEGLMGLSGETGEVVDWFKKWIFQESTFDEARGMEEIGDVLWYLSLICHAMNWDLNTIMRMNLEKIAKRYPNGSSAEAAEARSDENRCDI